MPTDEQIEAQIERLDAERERLWQQESTDPEHEHHATKLEQVRVDLDLCWDLLRQREGLRDAGKNPDEAKERPVDEVEGYLQ